MADIAAARLFRSVNARQAASVGARLAFYAAVAGSCALMWLSYRLPMLDLPQHAAQIALWRDLLLHKSHWSHLVYINLLTPYLIGYGAALPFSFFLSLETSVRIVVTASFLAFVASCVSVRRELNGDARLDWLFLPGFFGFDWKMGFITFLAAAPIMMWFVKLALRYRAAPSLKLGAALVVLGTALLFSHGLVFLFGMLIAGLLLLGPLRESLRARAKRLWPVATLTAILAAFILATTLRGTAAHYDVWQMGQPLWLRPFAMLLYVTGTNWDLDTGLAGLACIAMISSFFVGARWNIGPASVLAGALVFVSFALPENAFQTGYLYDRFAVFLMPFVAFQFRAPANEAALDSAAVPAQAIMILACLTILFVQAERIWAFNYESRTFNRVEQAAEPGKRALGLIFQGGSAAADNSVVYDHFPLWYQADDHGFVDFNFAAFHPQIVRFRLNAVPAVGQDFILTMAKFNWRKDNAGVYNYFFIRGSQSRVAWLQARSPCRLSLVAADAPWFLVQRKSCPANARTPVLKH